MIASICDYNTIHIKNLNILSTYLKTSAKFKNYKF